MHSNPANQTVRMADIAAALSHALDLTEGQAMSSSGKLGKSLLGHEVSLLALGISLFGQINSLFV